MSKVAAHGARVPCFSAEFIHVPIWSGVGKPVQTRKPHKLKIPFDLRPTTAQSVQYQHEWGMLLPSRREEPQLTLFVLMRGWSRASQLRSLSRACGRERVALQLLRVAAGNDKGNCC
jgi:hypothetical protein